MIFTVTDLTYVFFSLIGSFSVNFKGYFEIFFLWGVVNSLVIQYKNACLMKMGNFRKVCVFLFYFALKQGVPVIRNFAKKFK